MQQLSLDFRTIAAVPEFYRQFASRLNLSSHFGNNLDALWDAITGEIALPFQLTLRHFHQHADPQQFSALISLLKEAEKETDGAFRLIIK
ncbi:ribonuclease inhibitor [Erwinia sp. OLTSP20]|nr:ribonuclease inhibitor [Erwinia sp. OAMSP11]PIJ71202.1 ribonuclease inhibitor [Erwinia sp. OLSSP12]PIJ79851.1 ribonuclease inhibitor [Erwinia sp. OLCASP19]PIJ81614.1 ribonuclease inhibitor [Erwinia sp. OLMTSP26]PIJ84029.1 ribonuclease inhibitor [Erwinia sp. OLMDSP33]PIJ91656.1 ribonuclease inhibitor [Erwinia sp. OLTSP20]PIJ93055.1 ribonuclease inhibitor [Erwinia sp. OLFS4]